jgi:hypothetical protein
MIEQALLESLTILATSLGLTPTPKLIGVIEPADASDLPALVISLEQSKRLANGLGERALLITDGALPWNATLNLANPVLPSDPTVNLLSSDRRMLTLPHGGLVRRDGSIGAFAPEDLQVTIDGAPSPPFTVEPLIGRLTFDAALPTTGTLVASYVLGQWERRVVRSAGVLKLAILAVDATTVHDLSTALLEAIDSPQGAVLPGLGHFDVAEIGSIGPAEPPLLNARRRVVRFSFEFEQEVNVPDASGGIIQRVPIQALVS